MKPLNSLITGLASTKKTKPTPGMVSPKSVIPRSVDGSHVGRIDDRLT